MDIPEFRLMLDALGPDLAAWPEDAADAAAELMMGSEAAQDLYAAAVAGGPRAVEHDTTGLADQVGRIIAGGGDKG